MNVQGNGSARRWAPIAVGAAAALALTGCSGSQAEEETDHLKIANFLDVTAWDPASAGSPRRRRCPTARPCPVVGVVGQPHGTDHGPSR